MAFIGNMNQYDYIHRDVLANILEAYGIIGPREVSAKYREIFGPHYAPYWSKSPDETASGGGDDKYQAVNLLVRHYEAKFLRDEAVAAGVISPDEKDTYWGYISDDLTYLQRTLAELEVECSVHTQGRFRKSMDNFFEGLKTVVIEMSFLSQRKSGRHNTSVSEEHRVEMIGRAKRHIGDAEATLKWLKDKMLDGEHPPSMADIDTIDGLAEVLFPLWSIINTETNKPAKVE